MKTYLKLLYKSILIILPFLLLQLYLRSCQLAYIDGEIPYYNWVKNLESRDFDVVILGDSTANAAFLPNILGENVVNLALGGTTPVENYHIFERYLERNKKPCVCYIAYADMHMSKIDNFYTRVLYSHILTLPQQMEIFSQAKRFDEKDILVDGWMEKCLALNLSLPAPYQPALQKSSFADRLEHNRHLYHNAEIHLGSYISRENGENRDMAPYTKEEFIVSDMCAWYHERLIDFCVREGIQVRLVKLPVSPPVDYSPEYIREVAAFGSSLRETYPGTTVDWFRDGFDQSDFGDWHHMNLVGAVRFSRLMREAYPEDFSDAPKSQRTLEGLADYSEITHSAELKEYLGQLR
jgi:hypothetical protein